jgi:pyruvate kinase
LIICYTETGKVARLISMYRPKATIVVCTDKMDIVRNTNLSRSCIGYFVPTFAGRE